MIRYVLTRHAHLAGVRLSRPGQWGNLPHPTADAAEAAAQADAAGRPFTIERRTYAPRQLAKGSAHG